jgi:DNA-binding NtrC family response regulator
VVAIELPPLRERLDDIPLLVNHILKRLQERRMPAKTFSRETLSRLARYEWPGNVRELERVIERAITLAEGDEIQLGDLPPALNERYSIVQPATEGGESMRAWGSRYARLVLERCDNNKRKACRVLDISYHTLQAYLRYTPCLKSAQKALLPPTPEGPAESDPDTETDTEPDAPVHMDRPTSPASEARPALPVIEVSLVPE